MKDKTNEKLTKLSSKSSSALTLQKNTPNLFVTKSFDKNLSTLQFYNNVFGVKNSYFNHIGDANTHFKKTLRKYNEFNGLKNTKWLESKCKKLKPKFNKKEYRQASGDAVRIIYPDKSKEVESEAVLDEDFQQDIVVEKTEKILERDFFEESFDQPRVKFQDELEEPQAKLQNELKEHLEKHLQEHFGDRQEEFQDEVPEQDIMPGNKEEETKRESKEIKETKTEKMEEVNTDNCAVYPQVDTKVMSELEDAESQARETANVINDLKQRVTELLCKNHMTDKEAEELEEMNFLLTEHMSKFEEKTKLIQMLVNTADQQIRMLPDQKKHKEDMLPKVVICGMTENNMPKILICESKKPKSRGGKGGDTAKSGKSQDNKQSEKQSLPRTPPGQSPGYTRGQSPCQSPGYHQGQSPGYPPGQSPGYHQAQSPCQSPGYPPGPPPGHPCPACVPQIAKRLSQSYDMQEKLAADNIDLEGKRYELQEQLMCQDKTVEGLQRQLTSMQQEMRALCKENAMLTEKLTRIQGKCKTHPELPCGSIKGICPADVENRLQHYQNATSTLERQVELMEDEVKRMQEELVAVKRERAEIEYRRVAKEMQAAQGTCKPTCQGPCRGNAGGGSAMCSCSTGESIICPPTPSQPTPPQQLSPSPCCTPQTCGSPSPPPPCGSPCPPPPCTSPTPPAPPPPCPGPCCMAEQQLRELREQYNRLQDDYKSKLVEVAGLRADNETMKRTSSDNERLKRELNCKLEEMEREIKKHQAEKNKMMGSKEMIIEQEQQLAVAKQRFREAQDELDELRACIQDQATQLDDYRNKYLTAQQQVEEQRRQIDVMEMENARIGEQVTCEIQRVKAQFQERLAELAPLPDILKATQLKLQEEQHCRGIAERNADALARELQMYKDKLACLASQMEKQKNDQMLGEDERVSLMTKISGWECKCTEMQMQNERLKTDLARCEEQLLQVEKRVDEKLHEIAQLTAQLENVREESARQVTRTKERCETVRRSLQAQVAELERQLAQSRAAARAAQKDRDEIRHKMQAQITNLNDNFEEAQLRIRSLQGHVNFLKSSYTTMFGGDCPVATAPCVQPVADDDSNASCNCTSTYT